MILLQEGFDLIAPSDAAKRGWDSIAGVSTGRFSTGQCASTSTTTTKLLRQASTDTVILQCGYKAAAQTAPVTLFVGKQAGTVQFTLVFDPSSSTFKFYRGDTSTGALIAASSTFSFGVSLWHFIELAVKIASSGGTISLNVDSTNVISATGLNTLATTTAKIDRVGIGGGASADFFDDLVVLDNSGSTNNASIGDVSIEPHFPTADSTAHHDFVPSSGTVHFSLVDETTPNATDSVSSANLNDMDTYVIDDVATGTSILAVQVSICAFKDNSGTRAIAPVIRQGTTDYVGISQSPLTSETFLTQIYETNPATSAAFTVADFNAAEFGVKVTN